MSAFSLNGENAIKQMSWDFFLPSLCAQSEFLGHCIFEFILFHAKLRLSFFLVCTSGNLVCTQKRAEGNEKGKKVKKKAKPFQQIPTVQKDSGEQERKNSN